MPYSNELQSNAYWRLWARSHPEVRYRAWPTTEVIRTELALSGGPQ